MDLKNRCKICKGRGYIVLRNLRRKCDCIINERAKISFGKVYIPVEKWQTMSFVSAYYNRHNKKDMVVPLNYKTKPVLSPLLHCLSETKQRWILIDAMDIIHANFGKHEFYENLHTLSLSIEQCRYLIITLGLSVVNHTFGANLILSVMQNHLLFEEKNLWVLYETKKIEDLEKTYNSALRAFVHNLDLRVRQEVLRR